MTKPDDDLHAPLPQGVLSDLGRWTLYQSFRSFTWPWLLRRGFLLWPGAILAGSAYAAWHASGMGAWSDWPGLALRACIACLVAVTAGPLLATFVRHRRLPAAAERLLVLLAILAGLGVAILALDWAGDWHRHLMQRYSGPAMNVSLFGRAMSRFFFTTVSASTFALVLAGGGLALLYYFGERRRIVRFSESRQLEKVRAERDAADLRLEVLQAQIEPHFLFNTLASVRSLIGDEPERAARTVDALAAYLRATLPRFREDGHADSTLDRQVDICLRYLELMNIRTGGRIAVAVDADPGALSAPFPPLILLTLVENAVRHGIEPKPGPAAIAIVASSGAEGLEVRVEDDGVGLAEGVTPGLGLANVRAQLRGRYGERARLDVESRREGGVVARLLIPRADG